MEYYDTDSFYDIKKLNQYTETLKVVRPTAGQSLLMKLYLNSYYGKMISSIHFIDGKEKNMNKDYIVIHVEEASDINRVGIMFKSKIVGILKGDEGKAQIMVASGYNVCCTDSYEDIIKQLI